MMLPICNIDLNSLESERDFIIQTNITLDIDHKIFTFFGKRDQNVAWRSCHGISGINSCTPLRDAE